MRRTLLLTCGLLIGACQTEGESTDPIPVETVERSPDENEPATPPASVEMTGAPVAALHAQASRETDPGRAAELFETACDRSFLPSCIAFADALEAGDGLEVDPERARIVLEQACMDGSTIACDRMGH